jgi:glycosyltransferase involved in cell wall biosynthesis
VAAALGLPLSIKARGSDIHLWGSSAYARKQMLAAAGQAAGMLAVSAALKADMAALGMPADKIAVHYTGLDHAHFQPLPRKETRAALVNEAGLAIPATAPLLIGVGNLIPLKGHDLTIPALARLPDAHLILAGTGPEASALQGQAQDLGLEARVHLLGSVKPDVLARWLAASDVFVLPSEREGLANGWIEALACGTPLVISEAVHGRLSSTPAPDGWPRVTPKPLPGPSANCWPIRRHRLKSRRMPPGSARRKTPHSWRRITSGLYPANPARAPAFPAGPSRSRPARSSWRSPSARSG